MVTTCLREFIQQVPSCFEADSLACLKQCFKTGTHQAIVITDESHRPSGNILLSHWLVYSAILGTAASDRAVLGTVSKDAPKALKKSQDNSIGWHTPIHDVIRGDASDPLTLGLSPVAIAPDYWSLEQFRDHAQLLDYLPNEAVVWVVVDRQGAYLGMLDERAVWRSLALNPSAVVSSPFGQIPEVGDRRWLAAIHQPPTSQSGSRSEERQGIRFAVTDATESTDILIQLIENLPLPLMVQTADGEAILHNTPWQQHISNLQNLDTLQSQISGLLNHNTATEKPHAPSPPQQFCEMSQDANECVCTCTMADGDNQTWKFIKVPLTGISLLDRGITPPSPEAQSAIAPSPATASSASFQLAELGNPSPKQAGVATSTEPSELPQRHHQHHPSHLSHPLWLVIAQNITTHHRVTQSLAAQNENLEQSNRLKDEFLHCITHELKTPLTSMLGLSSLLKDQAIGSLNERQIQYAHLIYKSGRQLVSLVNNILDLTRLETGEFQLNFDVVNIQSICEQAYREALEVQDLGDDPLSRHSWRSPHSDSALSVSFTLDIQPGLHHTVADSLRLKQMLVQLLSNALKFSHFRGRIELHVSLWESWLAFTVTDQGVGIPLDKQHLIFQKFQQVEHPLTRTFEGAGLGLVLVQKLAEVHGGDISFTSEEGQGSQFTLLLPAAPPLPTERMGDGPNANVLYGFPPSQPQYGHPVSSRGSTTSPDRAIAPSSPSESASQHRGLVVIVESSASVLKAVTRHLNQLGFRVVVARSGTEALGKIRRLQPTVILLSLAVPMLSGLDVLLLLKTDVATRHIPIITLSSASELQKAKELGANAQLEYPVGATELYSSLHHVTKGTREPSPPAKSTTVLYLNPDKPTEQHHGRGDASDGEISLSTEKLNALLHPLHCRVLEVDDMEQAELLSQVWKPNVILLGNAVVDYDRWLAFLNRSEGLATLPVITLTLAHTEAANRETRLKVFPCLNFNASIRKTGDLRTALSPLVEAIQIASGVCRVPHVIVLNLADLSSRHTKPSGTHDEKRLEASVRYLQTAGIKVSKRGVLEQSAHTIDPHIVDLLLVYCPLPHTDLDRLSAALQRIRQQHTTLPILLWADDEYAGASTLALNTETAFASLIESLDMEVICGRLPMNEILTAVSTAIAHH